jgi:hypothetical protein
VIPISKTRSKSSAHNFAEVGDSHHAITVVRNMSGTVSALVAWARLFQYQMSRRGDLMLGTILLIVLILLLLGALPVYPYSRGWGYYPSSGIGLLLVIVIILVLMRWV